jgi:hypothetical protein
VATKLILLKMKAMIKNLNTADIIVKLALAIGVTLLYTTRIIVGPLAKVFVVLAVSMVIVSVFKGITKKYS